MTSFTAALNLRSASFDREFEPRSPSACNGCGSSFCSVWNPASCKGRRSVKEERPLRTAGLSLELITDRAGFEALEPEWSDLYGRAGSFSNPFLSFGWCWHWCNHFLEAGSGTELRILIGRRLGRLVMVWPMVQQRVGGMSSLTWLGAPVSQYGDVLAESGEDTLTLLEQGWDHLRRDVPVDFVALWKVRDDSTIAPLLKKLGMRVTRADTAPFVDLASAPTFEDYAKRFSSSRNKKRRRSIRQLESQGPVGHDFVYEGQEARSLSLRIIAMKRRWLVDKGIVSSGLSDPRTGPFFADVAEGIGHPTGCRILALTCGDDIVAGEISFASGDNVSGHIVVFNGDYDRQSPGLLLTQDQLRLCKEYGYQRYDFMGPCEQHKLDWADGVVGLHDYAIASSLRGSVWVNGYLGWGRPRLKKLINSIPGSVRGRIAKLHPALARFA